MRAEGEVEERSHKAALELAVEELKGRALEEVAEKAGATWAGSELVLRYLGREVRIRPPDFEALYEDGRRLPPKRRLLILHYLKNAKGRRPTGKLVDFRQIPSGPFYYPVFVATVERPLLQKFGQNPEKAREILLQLGGRDAGLGDVSVTVNVLPFIPLTFVFYRADEEFPPSCKLLFDETISNFYTAEDARILAEDVVQILTEMAGEG